MYISLRCCRDKLSIVNFETCDFKTYMPGNTQTILNVYLAAHSMDNTGNVITTVVMLYKHYCTTYTNRGKLQKYCVYIECNFSLTIMESSIIITFSSV